MSFGEGSSNDEKDSEPAKSQRPSINERDELRKSIMSIKNQKSRRSIRVKKFTETED